MILATKTLAAIEAALHADQGAKFRGLLKDLMPLAGDAYDTKDENWRTHLGASLIGRECGRELWYSFRWATLKRHEGRIVRLFNRGHLEEPRMVALLLMIGCKVWQVDAGGKQFRISGHRKHFGGSLDGVGLFIPDLDADEPCLLEFKTHGEKSFLKLVAEGVMTAKWEHVVQQQLYMGKMNLRWSLYLAVNKNTDELYGELLRFDPIIYQKYIDRSVTTIDSASPPPKINQSPSYYKCKFCDHFGVCHDASVAPARNCRTCIHSRVEDEGVWLCVDRHSIQIDAATQREGCKNYQINPIFKA